MEPPDRSPGPRYHATGTVTVGELIARCAGIPAPPPRPTGPEGAVSVAALLRREGRGPHVADRPLQPRGHARIAQPPPAPPRRSVRKVTVAAGALFAATAVLGPSVVEDSAGRSTAGQRAGFPLAPMDLPPSAGYDWSSSAERTSTGADGPVIAAMRQVIAEGIPSEVSSVPFDRLAGLRAAAGQYTAIRRVQTPDRASAGSTGPAVTPESGTLPPGGAGTPPGGTWSHAAETSGTTPPARGNPGGGPPTDTPGNGPPSTVPAGARSSGAPGNGHAADKPGNGPPSSTPASAKSEGGSRNGPPTGTPGNGPPSSTPSTGDGVAAGGRHGRGNGGASAAGDHHDHRSTAENIRRQAATDRSDESGGASRPPDRGRGGSAGEKRDGDSSSGSGGEGRSRDENDGRTEDGDKKGADKNDGKKNDADDHDDRSESSDHDESGNSSDKGNDKGNSDKSDEGDSDGKGRR